MLMRLLLRASSLGAKFALTVAVARALGFAAVADYGLAVAVSVIASKLFGLGFSSALNRRLAAPHPLAALRDARKLGLVYGGFYLLICGAFLLGSRVGWLAFPGAPSATTVFAVLCVAIAEHYAFEVNSYVFSLHRANAGSLMLFVRTGLWPALAIAAMIPGWIATIDGVLLLWIGANAAVIVGGWRLIAAMQRRESAMQPAPHAKPPGALRMWKEGGAFYLAAGLLSGMQYVERFIAAPVLGEDGLGRYVFAWSAANAVQTVSYAVFVVTAGPALARAAFVEPHRFAPLLGRAITRSLGVTIALSLAVLCLHDAIFRLAHVPADTAGFATLVVLLMSFVLRSVADLLWSASIALKAGRAVAWSMATLATLSVPLAWIMIQLFGRTGAAFAHLFASLAIVGCLAWIVYRHAFAPHRVAAALRAQAVEQASRHAA